MTIDSFKFYLYVENQNGEYDKIAESESFYAAGDTFVYRGFLSGKNYKIYAEGIDTDGDIVSSDELLFHCEYQVQNVSLYPEFQCDTNSVTVDISSYAASDLKIFRKHNERLYFAGSSKASSSTSVIFRDYNLNNFSTYSYLIEIGNGRYIETNPVYVDFEFSTIIGTDDLGGNIIYNICPQMSYSADLADLKLNIKNQYVSGFNKYETEQRGYLGNIQSSYSFILPDCLTEDEWFRFAGSDYTKIIKLSSGRNMIIGIESSSVKPNYFPSDGIVMVFS